MELRTFLEQFNLSEEELSLMERIGSEHVFRQGEDISTFDKTASSFYFIKEGLIRSYRIIDGDDFTYTFYLPGDICVDYESILKKNPSQHYFEVLAPTITIKYTYAQLEQLFEKHPRVERIARKMAESAYIRLLERVREFQSDTLEQRYLNLIKHHEDIFHAAPLQHLASYLGVKPQSLSRIRAKIVKR